MDDVDDRTEPGPAMLQATWELVSPEATAALAHGLASVLRAGDVVALEGELGAGKTTLVRGVVEGLSAAQAQGGADESGLVASPTFVFVHVYPMRRADIARVIHVDAYRLSSDEDLEVLGWDQLFDARSHGAAADAVALVEWPQRIAGRLPGPEAMASLRIEHLREGVRRITGRFPQHWSDREGMGALLERSPAVCPRTRVWVSPTASSYPFASERARGSDLYSWLTQGYVLPRKLEAGEGDESVS